MPSLVLTMLYKESRQTCCTANNHRNTQDPTTSKIAEAWPQENICWQLASPSNEEVENFVSTFARQKEGNVLRKRFPLVIYWVAFAVVPNIVLSIHVGWNRIESDPHFYEQSIVQFVHFKIWPTTLSWG